MTKGCYFASGHERCFEHPPGTSAQRQLPDPLGRRAATLVFNLKSCGERQHSDSAREMQGHFECVESHASASSNEKEYS